MKLSLHALHLLLHFEFPCKLFLLACRRLSHLMRLSSVSRCDYFTACCWLYNFSLAAVNSPYIVCCLAFAGWRSVQGKAGHRTWPAEP